MRRILALLPLVALLATMAVGPDAASGWERFNLFNACRPMRLVIQDLDDDATEIGLTREMLKAAAESRLRAARLYTGGGLGLGAFGWRESVREHQRGRPGV